MTGLSQPSQNAQNINVSKLYFKAHLSLVNVHMHRHAHMASLNFEQSLIMPMQLCSHWELELDLLSLIE